MAGKKPKRVEVLEKKRLLDSVFKVDEVTVSHERFEGGLTAPRPVLVFERGDAAAAILYDPNRRKIIAVKQFRFPTLDKGRAKGWLVEAVAGIISAGPDGKPLETPLECAIREVREETGYQLKEAVPISSFFASPGASTELIHLFYAEVNDGDKVAEGGGVPGDGEDIQTVEYDIDDFFRRLAKGEFEDAKLIIGGLWLWMRLQG
jgi:nudix-type nucleoside diphosphatase (YffH/AdpP family)